MKNAEGWHPTERVAPFDISARCLPLRGRWHPAGMTEGVVTPDISSRFLPLLGGRKELKAKEENPMKPFMDQDFLLENDAAK